MIKTKNEKGVTLIALVVTVIVILILTSMLIYKSKDSAKIRSIEKLYNDIELLRSKVNEYYDEYGALPILKYNNNVIKYDNISMIRNMDSILNDDEKTDLNNFYIIDLEKLKGVTLNYGKDYNSVKSTGDISDYSNLYIINSTTHNIFYVAGIDTKYFTDYTEPDNTKIDLRYIDGILIPDGYLFEKKDDDGNIVIINDNDNSNNSDSIEYTWVKDISEVSKVPDSITLGEGQSETDFINSVNEHDGYFVKTEDMNKSSGKSVIYL